MEHMSIGLLISVGITFILGMLFRAEMVRGARYGEGIRSSFDRVMFVIGQSISHALSRFGLRLFRQVLHYLFHTVLRFLSKLLKRVDFALQNVMRANKSLAKLAEHEEVTEGKLKELTLHKAKHTLTDEEKRIERERSLNAG